MQPVAQEIVYLKITKCAKMKIDFLDLGFFACKKLQKNTLSKSAKTIHVGIHFRKKQMKQATTRTTMHSQTTCTSQCNCNAFTDYLHITVQLQCIHRLLAHHSAIAIHSQTTCTSQCNALYRVATNHSAVRSWKPSWLTKDVGRMVFVNALRCDL